MNTQNNGLAYTISIGVGIVIWFLFNLFTNVPDPQSNILYWYIGYPIFIITSFILSYYFSIKAWRWPLCLILSQLVIGIVTSNNLNLLPLGIIVHIVISIPCFIAGYCGFFLKKNLSGKP
jgi:hypothetical protein